MEVIQQISDILVIGLRLYIWLHILAIIFSWVGADSSSQFVQIIHRFTVPLWRFVQRKLPLFLHSFSAVIAILGLQFLIHSVPGVLHNIGLMAFNELSLGQGLLGIVMACSLAALLIAQALIFLIGILAVLYLLIDLSNAPTQNVLVQTVCYSIAPLLLPIRQMLPRARFDLSPIVLLILCFVVHSLLTKVAVYLSQSTFSLYA